MQRAALLVLPMLAVAVIAFALFVVGAPRPYQGVRLYGGPTEGSSVLSWRVGAVERLDEAEAALPFRRILVELAFGDGRRTTATSELDEMGMASLWIDLRGAAARGPINVHFVSEDGRTDLGRGTAWLARDAWLASARREGGWLMGRRTGALSIRAAPARGLLAVPFAETLLVEVRGPNGLVEGADLVFEPEGVDILRPRERRGKTNAIGLASIVVAPREHNVALRIRANTADGADGDWYSLLPIVPGALRALLDGERLRIESPIVRERAYFALVSEAGRHAGGALRLAPDGRGGAVAFFDVPGGLPQVPIWGVVSSEPELDTRSTIGWPLVNAVPTEPLRTLTVADRLLVDTLPQGYRKDAARRSRARWLAGVFTVLSAILVGVLMVGRVRAAESELESHLARAAQDLDGAERVLQSGSGLRLVVALIVIGLGFTIVALVAMYRMR